MCRGEACELLRSEAPVSTELFLGSCFCLPAQYQVSVRGVQGKVFVNVCKMSNVENTNTHKPNTKIEICLACSCFGRERRDREPIALYGEKSIR